MMVAVAPEATSPTRPFVVTLDADLEAAFLAWLYDHYAEALGHERESELRAAWVAGWTHHAEVAS